MKRFAVVLLCALLAAQAFTVSVGEGVIEAEPARGTVEIRGVGAEPMPNEVDEGALEAPAIPASLRLKINEKYAFEIPDATFGTSKKSVATVSRKGVVTAKKVGTATITVKTADGRKEKVKVRVYDPKAVAEITAYMGEEPVSGKTLEMDLGSTAAFGVMACNADGEQLTYKVTWKSSKKTVATVDSGGRLVVRGSGSAKITAAMKGRETTFTVKVPKTTTGVYKDETFIIVNTPANPIEYGGLTYAHTICTRPKHSGKCLNFCYYYVDCMMKNRTRLSASKGARGERSDMIRFDTEKYGERKAMMKRLYDLINTGVPQILMVEAVTHPGSRHFVVVVGYRASVTRREDLRPRDLLIIDSHDGRLESMDPGIDPVETRVLFKQGGRYRIEAAKRR